VKNVSVSRRNILKLMAGSGVSILLNTGCTPFRTRLLGDRGLDGISPIYREIHEPAPLGYSGDDPATPHQILWAKEAFAAERKMESEANTESASLVIIGGGISGLLSAYLLREHNPVVLEQASRFGGNSKGQSYRGIDYSIGAAYLIKPDPGSPIEALYQELRLADFTTIKPASNPQNEAHPQPSTDLGVQIAVFRIPIPWVRARVVGTATLGYRPEVPVSPTTSLVGPALGLLEAAIGECPTPERLVTAPIRGIPRTIIGPPGPEYPLSNAYPPS